MGRARWWKTVGESELPWLAEVSNMIKVPRGIEKKTVSSQVLAKGVSLSDKDQHCRLGDIVSTLDRTSPGLLRFLPGCFPPTLPLSFRLHAYCVPPTRDPYTHPGSQESHSAPEPQQPQPCLWNPPIPPTPVLSPPTSPGVPQLFLIL